MGEHLQIVTTVHDLLEAEMLTGRLRSAGIPAAFHTGPNALWGAAAEPIPIFVPSSRVRRAFELLARNTGAHHPPAGEAHTARERVSTDSVDYINAVLPAPEPAPPQSPQLELRHGILGKLWAGSALGAVSGGILLALAPPTAGLTVLVLSTLCGIGCAVYTIVEHLA